MARRAFAEGTVARRAFIEVSGELNDKDMRFFVDEGVFGVDDKIELIEDGAVYELSWCEFHEGLLSQKGSWMRV